MNTKILLIIFFFLALNGKETFSQVNLQTGAATPNVPLYSYSHPGSGLSLNVSLSYTLGNGLKVSEVASNVGTGWMLDCGGFIHRRQNGEPDDQKQLGTFSYPASETPFATEYSAYQNYLQNYYPNGFIYSEYDINENVRDGASQMPLFASTGVAYKHNPRHITDRAQDVFTLFAGGRSASFVIGKKNGTNALDVRFLNDADNEKYKVVITEADQTANGIRTSISKFTIIDENGIAYIFQDLELNEICIYDNIKKYDANGDFLINSTSYGYPQPVSWSYVDVARGRAINEFVVGKWHLSEIVNQVTNEKIVFNYETYDIDLEANQVVSHNYVDSKHSYAVTWERMKGKGKRLTSVAMPEGDALNFNYGAYRVDVPTDRLLSQLLIKSKGQDIFSWNLQFGYFTATEIKDVTATLTDSEKRYARLCLKSIQRQGVNSFVEPPFKFDYYLPETQYYLDRIPPMFSLRQDHYGYATLGALAGGQEPYGNKIYPISFYSEITESGHYTNAPYGLYARNGVIKKITYPLGGDITYEYDGNFVLSGSTEIRVGGVKVIKTTVYDGESHANDIVTEYVYKKTNGQTSGWGYETPNYTNQSTITVYNCGDKKYVAGLVIGRAIQLGISAFFGYTFIGAAYGYGATFLSQATGMGIGVIVAIILYIFPPVSANYTALEYKNQPVFSHNPLLFQYSRVEVINKTSSTTNAGKTVYEFTDESFRPVDIPALSAPYSNKQRFAPWAYGAPKTITAYNNAGDPVKKTVYEYDANDVFSPYTNDRYKSRAWAPSKTVYECVFQSNSTNSGNIVQETYYPLTGTLKLTQKKEYFYRNATESNLVTTNYEYNSRHFLKRQYGNDSKGELVETLYYYPFDYADNQLATQPGTQDMAEHHVLSPVISMESYKTVNGNKYITGGVINDYREMTGGIKLYKKYQFQSREPVLNSSLQPKSAVYFLRDPAYFKEIEELSYDAKGNPNQVKLPGDRKSSSIFYSGRAVASATNASPEHIAYSSFESSDELGGWSLTGTFNTDEGMTGKGSFSGTASKSVSSVVNFTVTCWSKVSAALTVNGSSGTTLLTIGDWSLKQFSVSNASSIQVVGDKYDDLRLHPANSKMSTMTYLPGVGKVAESDVNNRITYYDYDELGRIKMVKDQYRNVMKAYEYNYKQ